MKRFVTWIAAGSLLAALGFACGYAFYEGWGQDLLRREVALILTDLLEGEVEVDEVQVVLSRGLGLYGRGLRAYPTNEGPGLAVKEAYIELHELALLLGDFELSLLILDGVDLRARLAPDGSWTFPPHEWLEEGESEPDEHQTRPVLRIISGTQTAARVLFEEVRIADRVVVHQGTILFEDRTLPPGPKGTPGVERFQLQQIEGILARPWRSDDASLALSAILEDPAGKKTPIRWTGSLHAGSLQVNLAADEFDLQAIAPYVRRLSPDANLEGEVSGQIQLDAHEPGHRQATLELAMQDVAPTLVIADERIRVDLPMHELTARLEVEPGAARLVDARATGHGVDLSITGSVVRPILPSSRARVEAQLGGITIEDIGPIARQLPEATGSRLGAWLARVESGRVDRFSLTGSTTLDTWQALLGGKRAQLPPGFRLGLKISEVELTLDEDDRLSNASFAVDWSEDRLEIHDGHGDWKGSPLPEINLTIDGLSDLVGLKSSLRHVEPEPLPGLSLVWDMILQDSADETQAETPRRRFQIEVDYIDHPVLGWPVENALLAVQPLPRGTEFALTRGTWGGLPVVAEIVYLAQPQAVVNMGIRAGQAQGPESPPAGTDRQETAIWGRGRFFLAPAGPQGDTPQPGSRTSGNFAFEGSEVRFSQVQVDLFKSARIAAELTVDLGDPEQLLVDFEGRIENANMEDLGVVVGLPEGFATGAVDIQADIRGSLVPDENLFAGLHGTIHGKATDGKIRQNIPLAVAVATATDGYNPFSSRDRIQYDKIETEVQLDRGSLTAERFELDGPIRIFASGTLDFAEPPEEIDAVIGVFLFQRVRKILGHIPLVDLILPGSKDGLVGAYFHVHGPWQDPVAEAMPMKSLTEGAPDIITRPFEILQSLWNQAVEEDKSPKVEAEEEVAPS